MNPTRFFRTALLACTTMALTALFTPVRATEGMWIPALLQAVEGDMQDMGLKLSAEDIYSINRSSLKDAIGNSAAGARPASSRIKGSCSRTTTVDMARSRATAAWSETS